MVSSPKPPDPYKQASAQQGAELMASQASAIINNPNQVNPYGTQTNKVVGWETVYDAKGNPQKVPRYQTTTTLSKEQQGLLNLQNQTGTNLGQLGVSQSKKLQGLLGTNLNTKGLNDWADFRRDETPTDRPAIEEAMMARVRENAQRQNSAQDAQLAARGMSPGSTQYSTVQGTRDKAMTDARLQAYLASGSEARQAEAAYNDATGQMNNLRGAQFGERTAIRNQPLNEISALMSGSQVTAPQFQPFSRQGINAAPVGQYIGQNYANQANASAQQNQGLFGLGGSIFGALGQAGGVGAFFSDRRLKEDIVPVEGTLAGCQLYSFRYIGLPETRIGVMADEVRLIHPDAVLVDADGYDMVDYDLLKQREARHAHAA